MLWPPLLCLNLQVSKWGLFEMCLDANALIKRQQQATTFLRRYNIQRPLKEEEKKKMLALFFTLGKLKQLQHIKEEHLVILSCLKLLAILGRPTFTNQNNNVCTNSKWKKEKNDSQRDAAEQTQQCWVTDLWNLRMCQNGRPKTKCMETLVMTVWMDGWDVGNYSLPSLINWPTGHLTPPTLIEAVTVAKVLSCMDFRPAHSWVSQI